MAKDLQRSITGFEHVRTPDLSILQVDFIFGKSGERVVNIPGTMIKHLNIFENMRYLCDTVQFDFADRMALLPELIPFNGTEKIKIEYGQDKYKTKKAHQERDNKVKTRYGIYDIFKTNYLNADLVNPTKWNMEFFLINSLAKPLFNQTHCRTFKNVTISDVIRVLIEDCKSDYINEGDLVIDIENTKEKGTFVQPMGWTNAQMINYLTELAGDFVFMIYGTNIIFKSISSMIKTPTPLETLWVSHKEYNQRYSDQKHLIIADSQFFLNNYFFNTVGARGITTRGFNFKTKKVLSSESTIPLQKPLALGEKFPFVEDDIIADGRFKQTGLFNQNFLNNKAKFKNISPFMNMMTSSVITLGRANREPGDILETIYRTADEENRIFNDIYSGQWLISAITHTFRGEAKSYFQRIELRRNAFGRGASNLLTPTNIKKNTAKILKTQSKMKGEDYV